MRPAGAWLAAALCALLVGCAAPGVREALRDPRLPERAELATTPFFAQTEYHCGPAALATVLTAIEIAVTPEALAPQVYVPARRGSLQIEMLAAARRNGAFAVELPDRLEALLAEISAGHPVLVLQNLGLSWAPSWHYAVAIGFDRDAATVTLRSGTTRREVMTLDTFQHTWNRAGRWAFVALRPGQLPASVSEAAMLQATLAYARVASPEDRGLAFAAAAARWPDNLALQIGHGNSEFAAGRLESARRIFADAARRHPDNGAPFNNLAHVLAELGDLAAAREAAHTALALDDGSAPQARQTLAEIESRGAAGR